MPVVRPLLAAVLVLAALSGCYLPILFDAEIDISRRGFYKIQFDGYLAEVNLYDDLQKKKVTKAAEQDRVKDILADFQRDRAVKEVKYFGQGRFRVVWQREGDILADRMVTFFRRNEAMLTISYVKETGLITFRGASISKANKTRLKDMGLDMQGEFRIRTSAQVRYHNAHDVRDDGNEKVYVWRIATIDERAPMMEIPLR